VAGLVPDFEPNHQGQSNDLWVTRDDTLIHFTATDHN
jgi:hypothetical protein